MRSTDLERAEVGAAAVAVLPARADALAGEGVLEGYHIYIGGGYGERQGIARELYRNVLAADVPRVMERILRVYLARRESPEETFAQFARRLPDTNLGQQFDAEGVAP